jgi:FixJ family two-component response regulator
MNPRTEQRSTVIVVDDDGAVREALSNLFRSVGLEVKVFASALEFLSKQIVRWSVLYGTGRQITGPERIGFSN